MTSENQNSLTMKNIIPLIALATLTLSACTKRGLQGPPGPPGPAGYDGVTNVQAFEYEVEPSAWLENGLPGDADYGFYAPASFPEITNDVLDQGVVLGYLLDGDAQVPMPALFYNNGYQTNYDFLIFPGEVEFWLRESDNQTQPPGGNTYYKMVVIENYYKNSLDWKNMSLAEVEELLKIDAYKKVSVK